MAGRRVRIYVSATADLESDREVVGESLARFPVPLAWEIRRTPHPGEQDPGSLAAVAASDLFVILLGRDITAPVGAELEAALAARLPLLAATKEVAHTPAGRFFRFNSIERWERYEAPEQLRAVVQRHVARSLLDDPVAYGLSAGDVAALSDYLRRSEKEGAGESERPTTGGGEPAGAQDGAVIVSTRR